MRPRISSGLCQVVLQATGVVVKRILRDLKEFCSHLHPKVNIVIWEGDLKMSSTTSFVVFVLICFVSRASCEETKPELNGTKIIWKDDFDKDSSEGSTLKTEYDAKGLQPWYDFANSFISTVLNKEPYGRLSYTVYCYFAFISCTETGDKVKWFL